jgi:hypothetical protein
MFGLMEDNGAEWSGMEWSGMEHKSHSIVWVSYDVTECCFHSIVWKVDGAEQVIIFNPNFTLN